MTLVPTLLLLFCYKLTISSSDEWEESGVRGEYSSESDEEKELDKAEKSPDKYEECEESDE